MKKFKENILLVLAAIVILWGVASFVDINLHNNPMEEDYKDYASWNFFTIIENL